MRGVCILYNSLIMRTMLHEKIKIKHRFPFIKIRHSKNESSISVLYSINAIVINAKLNQKHKFREIPNRKCPSTPVNKISVAVAYDLTIALKCFRICAAHKPPTTSSPTMTQKTTPKSRCDIFIVFL